MTEKAAADFYLTISGKTYPFFVASENGTKLWNDGVAAMVAPQFRTGQFGYEHVPPDIEVIESVESFWGGAGFETAPSNSGRYNYTRGIDRSYGDRSLLALKQQTALDSYGAAISDAPDGFYHSDTHGVFMWAGAYIYEFDAPTGRWVLRDDASADGADYQGIVELDGILYAPRGMTKRYKYSSDGVTWTEFDLLDDGTDERFDLFTVRGNGTDTWGLWGVANNTIKNTTDGTNGGVDWVGGDEVGHTSETPRSIITVDNEIYTFKKTGFSRYDGFVSEVVFETNYITDSNGLAYLHENGLIYAVYNGTLLEYEPYGSTALRTVYPSPGMNSGELRGEVRAVGGGPDGLRIAIKNANGNTYILRGVLGPDGGRIWHSVLYLGANDCNALAVVGPGAAHDTNPVLFVGYGTAAPYYVLPRNGLSPDEDGECSFDTSEGVAYGSYVAFGAKTFPKFLNRGAVLGYGVSAGRYATLKYEADRDGTETTLVEATSSGLSETNELNEVSFHLVRDVLYMGTGDDSSTPTVDSIALFATLNPRRKRTWGPVVLLSDELLAREGVNIDEVPSALTLRRILYGALTKRVVLTDREGLTYRCRLLDMQGVSLRETTEGGVERDKSAYQLNLVEITALNTDETEAIYGESAWGGGHVYG